MMGNYHVRCGAGEKSEVVTPETYLSLFTLPDSFVEKLSTMRSRNMSAVIIVQNLIQLKRKFPKFDMDKDLIGNCSIIDILGAPDMDSCEYLSKHFGTQTIHKASDSNAKDYKGQSSRSEDVMQKSLISTEDIFAMKKDGECAIVVKGTDPLYQKKCQMEKTSFVKLLCRKQNPYDPKKRKERKIKHRKLDSYAILVNDSAREEAKRLRGIGVPIIKMNLDDVKLLSKAAEIGMEVDSLVITDEISERIKENTRKYEQRKLDNKEFDFTILFDKNAEDVVEEKKKYRVRVLEVRKLVTAGYTYSQIRGMRSLLMVGYSTSEIKELFGVNEPIEKIETVIKILDE